MAYLVASKAIILYVMPGALALCEIFYDFQDIVQNSHIAHFEMNLSRRALFLFVPQTWQTQSAQVLSRIASRRS